MGQYSFFPEFPHGSPLGVAALTDYCDMFKKKNSLGGGISDSSEISPQRVRRKKYQCICDKGEA